MTDDEPRTLREEIMVDLPLNERELVVLEHAAKGLTAAEIGTEVYLAPETVRSYRKDAIAKLGARNIVHATAIAIGMGYVNVEPVVAEYERRRGERGAA